MVEGDTPGEPADAEIQVLPSLEMDPLFLEAVEDAVLGVDESVGPGKQLGRDRHDFAGLYIRHRSSFALHAGRFLRDRRDVEEVVQEAFLRLFLAMPELESELQAIRYCRRTISNLCIDRYRADQRRPILIDFDEQLHDSEDEDLKDPVLAAEDAALVRQALALLTPTHRAALIKREIEEKPLPQIAEELGLAESAVKHTLLRARRALRRLLAGTAADPTIDLTDGARRPSAAMVRTARAVVALLVLGGVAVGVHGVVGSSPASRPNPIAGSNPALLVPVPTTSQAPAGPAANPASPRHRHVPRATAPHSSSVRPPAAHAVTRRHVSPARVSDPRPPVHHSPSPRRRQPSAGSPPPAPPVVGRSAGPAFTLKGTYTSGAATVRDQVRMHDVVDDTYVSTSAFAATTKQGTVELNQALGFHYEAGQPVVDTLDLNPVLPVSAGATGYSASVPSATVDPSATGYALTVSTAATSLTGADSAAPTPLTVSVHIRFSPDLTTVLSETVTMVLTDPAATASPQPVASPSPSSGSTPATRDASNY